MSKRLSEMYGMKIYTTKAMYVGTVEDIILNLDKGEIMRLCLKSFRRGDLTNEEIKQVLQEDSIDYSEVVEVGDIILVQKPPPSKKFEK